MKLPAHKTKIVCTIGPASDSPGMLERLMGAGMNIARLNFSHGDFAEHAERISRIRAAAHATERRVAIMADLPGPKMRIGQMNPDPVQLHTGDEFLLTVDPIIGDARRASVSFEALPKVVREGEHLFLNDGLVELIVQGVHDNSVRCKVAVGGELRSKKGLNLPGIELGISAFTDRDRTCLEFALENGVDAISQSFVENAADVVAVRKAAQAMGKQPMVLAKIERSGALTNIDEILHVSDGIMVARGDLGVEIPIEQMAVVQKQLIQQANLAGKAVITATQMLESMVSSRLPTRAEATDVANAILDGADCVMLSAESAVGQFPEESVAMLARIAAFTESHRPSTRFYANEQLLRPRQSGSVAEAIASLTEHALETVDCSVILVPTRTGRTAKMISSHKPSCWVISVSRDPAICQTLAFSYGVHCVQCPDESSELVGFAREWLRKLDAGGLPAMLVAGPSEHDPKSGFRIEIIRTECNSPVRKVIQ